MNKASISPLPIYRYPPISTSQISQYLEDQLGFHVECDFMRWTGVSAQHSYVRMRAVFRAKDIISESSTRDYVDRVLKDNAAGMTFDSKFVERIKPFMYPESIINLRNHPSDLQHLYTYGVYGERLDELIRHSNLTYSEAGLFRVYLRPERIIADMLADPATNKIDGEMAITQVLGDSSETIRWVVEVSKCNSVFANNNISIDAVFAK